MERETVRVVESLQSVPGKRPRNSKYSTEARSKRKLVSSSAIREKKKKTVKSKLFESYRCSPLPPWTLISRSIDRSCGVERLINSVQGRIEERHALVVVSSFYIRARSLVCKKVSRGKRGGGSRFQQVPDEQDLLLGYFHIDGRGRWGRDGE